MPTGKRGINIFVRTLYVLQRQIVPACLDAFCRYFQFQHLLGQVTSLMSWQEGGCLWKYESNSTLVTQLCCCECFYQCVSHHVSYSNNNRKRGLAFLTTVMLFQWNPLCSNNSLKYFKKMKDCWKNRIYWNCCSTSYQRITGRCLWNLIFRFPQSISHLKEG